MITKSRLSILIIAVFTLATLSPSLAQEQDTSSGPFLQTSQNQPLDLNFEGPAANDLNSDTNAGGTIYCTETGPGIIESLDQNIGSQGWLSCGTSRKLCGSSSYSNSFYWKYQDCWNSNIIDEGTVCLSPYPEYTCTRYVSCPNGHTCRFYIDYRTVSSCETCSDECSQGATRCINSWYRESCGDYDSDSCFEWGNQTYCEYGCSSGQCNSTPACTDECSYSGQTRCNGDYKETCGNFDPDSCLEWDSTYCSDGCQDGECRTCNPHDKTKCVGKDVYWFDSCNRQEEMKDECRVECLWNSGIGAYCFNGCKANWKIHAFDLWRNGKANATVQYDLRDYGGLQYAGQTDSTGKLEFSKVIPYNCGHALDIKVVSAEGADCGEKGGFIEKENDTDTYFFYCPWTITYNGLKASLSTNKSTYNQEETVTLSIHVSDWWNNPVQGAFVGIILPNGDTATAPSTASSGNSTYNFTAAGEGNQKIMAAVSKVGYWNGSGETRFQVKEKPLSQVKLEFIENRKGKSAFVFLVSASNAGNYTLKLNVSDPVAEKYFDATEKTVWINQNSSKRTSFTFNKEQLVSDYYTSSLSKTSGPLQITSNTGYGFSLSGALFVGGGRKMAEFMGFEVKLSEEDQKKVTGFAMLAWGAYEVYDVVDTAIDITVLSSCGICVLGGIILAADGPPGDEILVVPVCKVCGSGLSVGMVAKTVVKKFGKKAIKEFAEIMVEKALKEGAERIIKKQIKEEAGEFAIEYLEKGIAKELRGELTEEVIEVGGKKYAKVAGEQVIKKADTIKYGQGFWTIGKKTLKDGDMDVVLRKGNHTKGWSHLKKHITDFKDAFNFSGSDDLVEELVTDNIDNAVKNADNILFDSDGLGAYIFLKQQPNGMYTKVVVSKIDRGDIITAFPIKSGKAQNLIDTLVDVK